MADYQRKPIVKPKTPPPPPPKPKRTFTETEESLVYNPVYNMPITVPQGAQPKELPPSAVFSKEGRLQAVVQTSPNQKKDDLRTSPPSRIYQNLEAPPLPPRNKALNTPPEKSLSKSPVAESTPKKGIFRSVYARAKDFFTGKSATPYESLHQQASPATSTTTPKKQGIFRRLLGGSTTPNRRQNDSMSDTASSPASPDRSYSGYSGDHETSRLNDSSLSSTSDPRRGPPESPDFSSEVSVSFSPEATGGGPGITSLRSADTSSDVSSSEDDCYERVERQQGGKLLSIQVNSPANIRVATSDSGEVTACIETASDRKKE